MSSTLNTFVPVLDGTNYQQWAASMQSFLMSQGQWRVITKNAPLPVYKNSTQVAPIKADDDTIDVQATRRAQAAADQRAMLTEPTNQDALDEWEELVSKAVGNIRLRLHHTIAYQYNTEDDAANLWQSLLNKYGQPGISRAYIEFKGAMDTNIPNNSDPSPSLDKMMAHFTRLRDIRFEIAPKVQAMMILAKAPASMETIVQVFFQEGDHDKLTPDGVITSMMTAWEAHNRSGNRTNNQQRANKLSAVKRDGGPPQFQQQQQQPYQQQQQRGDGTWQQRGRKRGKRAGVKHAQNQLQQAAIQQPPVQQNQGPPQPPAPQYQWIPQVGSPVTTSQMGYFAAQAKVVPPPPPPSTVYPTFNAALQLARNIGVRPSIEILKTLEVAEIVQGSSDPRPSKRARKSAPKQLALGAKGNIPSGYIVSSLWVLKQFTQLIPSG